MSDDITDDELLVWTRAAFDIIDPVPERVLEAGRRALRHRLPDAVLAELADDDPAPASAPGLRGGPRLLTFAGGDRTVEIEASRAGREWEIAGRLAPSTPARLRVRYATGERATWVEPSGLFIVSGVPDGPVSLVFRLPDATSLVTSWVWL